MKLPGIYRRDKDKVEVYRQLRVVAKGKVVTGGMLRFVVGGLSDNFYTPVLIAMAKSLDQGESLAGAMSEFPEHFSAYEILMVTDRDPKDKEVDVLDALYHDADLAQWADRKTKGAFVYSLPILFMEVMAFCLYNRLYVIYNILVSHDVVLVYNPPDQPIIRRLYCTLAGPFTSDYVWLPALVLLLAVTLSLIVTPARNLPWLTSISCLRKGFSQRQKFIEEFRVFTAASVMVKRKRPVAETMTVLSNLEIRSSQQDDLGRIARECDSGEDCCELLGEARSIPKEMGQGLVCVIADGEYAQCWEWGMSRARRAKERVQNYSIGFLSVVGALLMLYFIVGLFAFGGLDIGDFL